MWSQTTTRRFAEEYRRAAFPKLIAHALVAKIALPEQLAVYGIGVEPARFERRNQDLAVGNRGCGGPASVLRVRRLVRRLLAGCALPHHLARRSIDRQHHEAMLRWRGAARRVRLFDRNLRRDRRQDVNPIAPHNRRRRAAPGDFNFPADVLRVAPLNGRRRRGRHSRRVWPAPLRPEPFAGLGGGLGEVRAEREGADAD